MKTAAKKPAVYSMAAKSAAGHQYSYNVYYTDYGPILVSDFIYNYDFFSSIYQRIILSANTFMQKINVFAGPEVRSFILPTGTNACEQLPWVVKCHQQLPQAILWIR